jgi:hypothetical protein
VGRGVGVGDGVGVGRIRIGAAVASLDAHAWPETTRPPSAPHPATISNAAASVTPRWRRSMPSPCLLPSNACGQDTESGDKRTVRDVVRPAYH